MIKLFVCCHCPAAVPRHPLLFPIQVGAALSDSRFPGFSYDDIGEHISTQNHAYCELTAQYWAWKNIQADYYGFFHYRRYLYPNEREKLPYRIERRPSLEVLQRLGFDHFASAIEQHDIVMPKGENMHLSVREHYANAPFHHRKDLECIERIIRAHCPEYSSAMEKYLSGTVCYFGNIFIMKKNIFYDYCRWLFPILEQFDHLADLNGYNPQEQRVDGYLGERLLGIFYTRHQGLKALELPRVHFIEDRKERLQRKTVNWLLPPGSRRRYDVKRLWMGKTYG